MGKRGCGMHKKKSFNLTYSESKALKELCNRKKLIKPADKGGNIVLMDRPIYLKMCYYILSNGDNYKVLRKYPTQEYLEELRCILKARVDKKVLS